MPIRPEFRRFYRGAAWRETRERILIRAGNMCEECGKPNREMVETITGIWLAPVMFWRSVGGPWRDHTGARCPVGWRDLAPRALRYRVIRAKIGVAHLNHDPTDNSDDNLRALCDWCHLHYDADHHHETRAARKDSARPMQWEAVIAI